MIVGGAQENTLLTVRGLLQKGYDTVLLTGPGAGPEGELLATQRLPEQNVHVIPDLFRELNPLRDLKSYFALKRYFREKRFDIVHTHSSKAGILGRIAARKVGVPVIVHTVHGQAFHPYQSAFRNRLYIAAERVAAGHCDRILAVAAAMVDQCVRAGVGPEKLYHVVYSGMEMEPFLNAMPDMELRSRLGIPADALVVGKIARLFELKGHRFLIDAAPAIVERVPNVRFLLVGDGALRSSLESAVQERGLEDYFIFAGLVAPAEVPRYLALMDVLAHLSLREGLPRTVVQALAAGVPAVGFRLDGAPEVIIDGKTGILCEAEDVACVQSALLYLLDEDIERRRMGHRGRELVRNRFDWHRMVEHIESEYTALVAVKGRAMT